MDGIYTLAFTFPDQCGLGFDLFRTGQEVCKSESLHGSDLKMGAHVTVLPPFYAEGRELRAMELLCKTMTNWWRGGYVKASGFGCSPYGPLPEDKGAVYILLETEDPSFQKEMQKLKANWPFPFVSEQKEGEWRPHITVYEGPLHSISQLFPRMNEFLHRNAFSLDHLGFHQKHFQGEVSWWVPVKT